MKNKPIRAKTQRHKKIIASILHIVLFAYLIISTFGCNESSQPALGQSDAPGATSIQMEAFRIIQGALAESDPVARVNAIEVVASTGQIKLMPEVHRLLQDEFAPVRFASALAVGDLQYSLAKRSAGRLLKDKDVNVMVAAAYAMGRLGDAEYFEVVRKAIDSEDQTVRANAAFILGRTGDINALKLLKWAQEDKNSSDKVRFQVLEARARLGDEEVLQKLWAIVYSGYADDRIMGIRAMGTLGTSKARDMFRDRTGEPEVLAVFENDLTIGLDKQASERANVLAALAIGQIRTPALTKYLPQLLRNESKFVRIAAAKAVFQCKMR
ncbi:MAG: HEAT repeat domain-containing protein [Planctomycetota bacterium]